MFIDTPFSNLLWLPLWIIQTTNVSAQTCRRPRTAQQLAFWMSVPVYRVSYSRIHQKQSAYLIVFHLIFNFVSEQDNLFICRCPTSCMAVRHYGRMFQALTPTRSTIKLFWMLNLYENLTDFFFVCLVFGSSVVNREM